MVRGATRDAHIALKFSVWSILMPLTLTTVPLALLDVEREAHFERLGEGPELYLELFLRKATTYHFAWDGRPAGYCIRSEDGLVAELEIHRHVWHDKAEIFSTLIDEIALCGACCFSFDSLLLGLCIQSGWTGTIEGPLFRNLLDEQGPSKQEGRELRPAIPADIETILPYREGVFDTEDECRQWVTRGHVSILERASVFLGIGLLTRVWATRPEHDVGVMVHPDHRGRGHATFILRALKRRCLDHGMRPTAGCAAENVGSSRALQYAGFASQHSLIRFGRLETMRQPLTRSTSPVTPRGRGRRKRGRP
jgi:GNAT superfamily N-acetyltransferase